MSPQARLHKNIRRRMEQANIKALRLGRMDIPPAYWRDTAFNYHAKEDYLAMKHDGEIAGSAAYKALLKSVRQ